MRSLTQNGSCPDCGTIKNKVYPPHLLEPGTVLCDHYLLGEPLGQGGFGVTYIGRDLRLDMRIAVKEYFPSGLANRNVNVSDELTITGQWQKQDLEAGTARFLQEARTLARFHGTPGIVDVRDYFEANHTAYIVMEYLDGDDLAVYLRKKRFSADEIFSLIRPVIDALEKVHQAGLLHRDISPDNIMLLPDGQLKLMDFGASRQMNTQDQRSEPPLVK